jgi:hypothetical protein
MKKKSTPLIIGILICLVVMGLSIYWANSLMNSIYAFRSPLQDTPPKPGETIGKPITRSFVIVLIDALRYDTSLKSDVMPFLNHLRSEGAYGLMHSRPPSYSQPGYSVILTGAWPDISDGPAMNLDYADIPTFTQDNLYSATTRAGLRTSISAFNWFEKLIPQQAVSASFYTAGEDQFADQQVTEAALPWLMGGQYQLVLIHLDQVDYAGHYEGGPIDPRWDEAATRADGLLQQIATTMDLTKDTLLVISDHGQIDRGGHGGQDPIVLMEPFVLAGKSVIPGDYGDVQMVDIAPTIAAVLGTNIPATNEGHPKIGMFDFSLDQVKVINQALSNQQSQLALKYGAAIGQKVTVTPAADIVTATQTAMNQAKESLLNIQRIPRGIITFIALFFFLTLSFSYARPYLNWMLVGVVFYIVVFNIKYLLIDQKTYSLSSVINATNLIASTALTTLLALFVAWLVVMLGTKIYLLKPRKAAELTMKFVLVTLSILSIPVLTHFFVNGAIVTWTLPNFLISFLGLIFLVQCLVVAMLGLFFTGLSPLLGYFASGK